MTKQRKVSTNASSRAAADKVDFFLQTGLQSALIFAFAFLLYANTLRHGFVLDDGIVITENSFTQAGFSGMGDILSHDTFYGFFNKEGNDQLVSGGRYRPLSLLFFAAIYQFAGAQPFVYHLFTVLLFAFCCVVFYRTLLLLLPDSRRIAWLAAVLFAAHPIHTEVVANIKSCDEILALLGSLTALYCALKAADTGRARWAWWAGAAFFAACLAKENAVVYAFLIPLALRYFRFEGFKPAGPAKLNFYLWAALGVFLILRGSILPWSSLLGDAPKELLNNPFLKYEGGQWVAFSFAEKLATIFYTLWKYLQLLLVPHPLTHDYYPRHVDIMHFTDLWAIAGLLVTGAMVFWAVRGWSRRDTISYALWMYLLPLAVVSNLAFPVGTNMSERFAFMPSAGFCLAAAWLSAALYRQNKGAAQLVIGAALALFAIKTVLRNPAWASTEKLFTTDVAVSENSVKLQTAYSKLLIEQAKNEPNLEKKRSLCREALQRLEKSSAFYPNFKDHLLLRASAYLTLEEHQKAIADYRKALELAPDDPQRKVMLAFALRETGKYFGQQKKDLAGAFQYLNESWQVNNQDPETARLLGVAYFVQGNREQAVSWFQTAEKTAPNDAISLWELGVAYANLGEMAKAGELQRKALSIDPGIAQKAQLDGQ